MYIRKTTKKYKGKTYFNHLLVESVATPRGPRQKTICSLGDLSPGPREKWAALANRVQAALHGQSSLDQLDPLVDQIVDKVRSSRPKTDGPVQSSDAADLVAVHTDQVACEQAREAGPVHVGHEMWVRLGLAKILQDVGLSSRSRILTEVMALNRLVCPSSEHATPDWIRSTALTDILREEFTSLSDESLYRNLDRLHPNRSAIEQALAEREKSLFNLDDSYLLYDLTSTYFEGQCQRNPRAKRGYSRDKRPDCKQVVVGLVLDRDGFPKAHEVFEGNRQDRTSLDEMLDSLERRSGRRGGATVIVDRGMAFEENLEQIRKHGHHYLVACRQAERNPWLEEFEDVDGWEEIKRKPSPRNPFQKKSRVWIKRAEDEDHLYVLCLSEGRQAKDRAIREKHEKRLLIDLEALQASVTSGRVKKPEKIHQRIGRLKERYPRVARYWRISYDAESCTLSWEENTERKKRAIELDGSYLMKTDQTDLSIDEAWRLYMLLTRVENAFRNMKSPLSERPIFHQLEHRVETHIFLCVLAYHLLVSIEKMFLDQGIHTSWASVRDQLRTHQVLTVLLPTTDGRILKIRKGTNPEPQHVEIYNTLRMPQKIMTPVKTWAVREQK